MYGLEVHVALRHIQTESLHLYPLKSFTRQSLYTVVINLSCSLSGNDNKRLIKECIGMIANRTCIDFRERKLKKRDRYHVLKFLTGSKK